MIETERQLLQALLATNREAAAAAVSSYLNHADLQTVPWNQTRLFPTLYKRMTALDLTAPALLKGTYRRAWTENQARFRAAATTMSVFDGAGIRNVVLKGASLVPAYGNDWGVRDMADVDLLVDTVNAHRAAAILESLGWQPSMSTTAAGALARHFNRRHSWNFSHPDGPSLDLHWHVFVGSRGPHSDRAFFDAAVPLVLGNVRAQRLCDADLLLHVLEHANHHEEASKLLWIVDVVHLLRSVPRPQALGPRLTRQAATHDLVVNTRERLAEVIALTGEPAVALVLEAFGATNDRRKPPAGSRRGQLVEFRRGGTPLPVAVRALTRADLDAGLARRRLAWASYVAFGRRPSVERLLTRFRGPLTTVPQAGQPPADDDGWWQMCTPQTVDALCGPGWSFPESHAGGVWTDGSEARLSLPVGDLGASSVTVDMQLYVLGRHGGPPRVTSLRANGSTLTTLDAEPLDSETEITLPGIQVGPPPFRTVEISIRVEHPTRPVDLGIGADMRRLAVMLRKVRVRPLAGD